LSDHLPPEFVITFDRNTHAMAITMISLSVVRRIEWRLRERLIELALGQHVAPD
jgi:hypothetical protein